MFERLFDLDHPFFRPLWMRVAIVVLVFAWTAFELASGSPGWAVLFGALGAYSAYRFFVTFAPRDEP